MATRGAPGWPNGARILGATLAVVTLNPVRIALAIHGSVAGLSWFSVHTVPDLVIHVSVIVIASVLALRADRGGECRGAIAESPAER